MNECQVEVSISIEDKCTTGDVLIVSAENGKVVVEYKSHDGKVRTEMLAGDTFNIACI